MTKAEHLCCSMGNKAPGDMWGKTGDLDLNTDRVCHAICLLCVGLHCAASTQIMLPLNIIKAGITNQ